MVNKHRGEIEATIEGRKRTLCLTLGALAELESALDAGDLLDLGEKFSKGHISARHLIAIIGAGLRGGGEEISDEELAASSIDGGLKGAAEIAVRLLKTTFGEGAA